MSATTGLRASQLIQFLECDQQSLGKNILGLLGETSQKQVGAALLLAALFMCPGSLSQNRAKCQWLKPENLMKVIRGHLEEYDAVTSPPPSLDDAPLTGDLAQIAQQAGQWLERHGRPKLPEGVLLALLLPQVPASIVQDLVGLGFLDWESFSANLTVDPPLIELWSEPGGVLRRDQAFDRSGKKVVSNLEAEARGLGARQYDLGTLFISLLADSGSALYVAASMQKGGSARAKQAVADQRQHMKRYGAQQQIGEIRRGNCHPRLLEVLAAAADKASMAGRQWISSRDMCDALLNHEKDSAFAKAMSFLGLDLAAMFLTIQCLEPEPPEEQAVSIDVPLDQMIKKQLVGQDHAIIRIMPLIRRLKFGYRRYGKPAGVFLFLGPSGSGKTMMAKVLAETIFGSQDNLLMLEMGQYGTRESKSMFIGAPHGYVGYGEGKLTNGLRDMPEGVILFDEVEKADPLVLDVLLRFLDEGRIDDPAGPVLDGSKCLIVLTSNFLADKLSEYEQRLTTPDPELQDMAYVDLRKDLLNITKTGGGRASFRKRGEERGVHKFFRPEFVYRIDEIILFRSLGPDDYLKIAELEVEKEKHYLHENFQVSLEVETPLLEFIAAESFKRSNEGARVVNRLVNVYVINPLINHLANGRHHLALSMDLDPQTRRSIVTEQ